VSKEVVKELLKKYRKPPEKPSNIIDKNILRPKDHGGSDNGI